MCKARENITTVGNILLEIKLSLDMVCGTVFCGGLLLVTMCVSMSPLSPLSVVGGGVTRSQKHQREAVRITH